MRFRILGPLEATDDGAQVPLGGPKPRALLAALLLRPGAVISTDRLVIVLRGDAPPRDAVGTLRAYVSRLRAVLAPLEDTERLVYRPPGYLLAVNDDDGRAAGDLLPCHSGSGHDCAARASTDVRLLPWHPRRSANMTPDQALEAFHMPLENRPRTGSQPDWHFPGCGSHRRGPASV